VDVEALQAVAHHFGETVGVALRNVAHCPVELNLTPKGSIKKQELSRKTPYFIASVASLILGIFAIALFYGQTAAAKKTKAAALEAEINPLTQAKTQIGRLKGEIDQSKKDIDTIMKAVEERYWWVGVLNELNVVLTQVEAKTKASLGADVGVWIETFTPMAPGGYSIEEESAEESMDNMDEEWKKRYGPQLKALMAAKPGAQVVNANELGTIQCVIRAVNLHKHGADANYNLVFALKDAFTASPIFGDGIVMDQQQKYDTEDKVEKSLTFAIGMNLKLKRPLRF
jgi:Tfp pilus assembly protein PilN